MRLPLRASLLCSAALLAIPVAAAAAPSTYAPCAPGTPAPPTTNSTIFTTSIGADGQGGASSSFEGPGHAGSPGQAGGDLSYAATPSLNAISLYTMGGVGGEGSNAGSGDPGGDNGGGVGVPGGNGGTVTLIAPASVNLTSPGPLNSAVCAYSGGGVGGEAGLPQNNGPKHPSGPGGNGGDVTVTAGSGVAINAATAGGGVIAWSVGGSGADGKDNNAAFEADGGQAGPGGTGGTVTVTANANIASYTAGILAASVGGDGGTGGDSSGAGTDYHGGAGGNGGPGGSVYVTNSGSITTTSDGSPGIWAQSYGGIGGAGGGVGASGAGGVGGAGGLVQVTLGGTITVGGNDAPGALAQSFGGQGAPGGEGVAGGAGGSGGDGGQVILQGGGTIVTGTRSAPATNSQGILGQSVGGGGGNGGDSDVGTFYTIGGKGGTAANGGGISVNVGTDITTYGDRSQAILAQSIGGGGGNGGNSNSQGPYYGLTIGGSGAGGGSGGTVSASSAGTLQTSGEHATGMLLQSIGQGGGSGGSAIGTVTTRTLGIQVSVGGTGGGGGDGGAISPLSDNGASLPTNAGVVWTSGAESAGILAQSIGGGGGKGGPATASAMDRSITYASISFLTALGGNGGGGGQGGEVTLGNDGLVLTGGAASRGMVGQSIGGGGGDAGDASASIASRSFANMFIITHTVGGTAGAGGTGGAVSLANSGFIVTTGADAAGMLGQSIGGGGGTTGAGDGAGTQNFSVTGTLGSTGGSSGNGGTVSLTNAPLNRGSILTLGDGAAGMVAQAIGGGGGVISGLAADSSQNASYSLKQTLGASGGGGSSTAASGPAVNVVNQGPILSFGADAPGILAQSIGGGGGLAGKGASNLGFDKSTGDGGNGGNTVTSGLASLAGAGVGTLGNYKAIGDLLGLANTLLDNPASTGPLPQALATLSGSGGSYSDPGTASSFNVAIGLGAAGTNSTSPASWDGGATLVVNGSDIATAGRLSAGILAQSVGGGGGVAGAANSALNTSNPGANVASLSLGGTAGSAGTGGAVTVQNTGTASITTAGGLAPAIIAQSIGGGGGVASLSGSSTGLLDSLRVQFGSQNASGGGGSVTVTNAGAVATLSHDSPGIVAQSIGGGGGLVRLLATDKETSSGPVISAGDFQYGLAFSTGSCGVARCGGDGAAVSVTHSGSITTAGDNSYGILAQSIGGGGGAVIGGTPVGSNFFAGSPNGSAGQQTSVYVVVGNDSGAAGSAGNITTSGRGAVAILAQSIGGGGGLAGDTGLTAQRQAFEPGGIGATNLGDGGPILVQVRESATLSTSGLNTPVILAQSVGGGGGRVTNNGTGAFDGTAGGVGVGGTVNVNVAGQVLASGAASPGIFAESVGRASGNPTGGAAIQVNVLMGGVVQGGTDYNPGDGYSAGVYLVGGGTQQNKPNVVDNYGTITSLGSTAIYGTGGWTNVSNQSGAMINGSINLSNGGGGGNVSNWGTWNTGSQVRLGASGTLSNSGVLSIGGTGQVVTTSMTGTLVQTGTGRLVVDTDHRAGVSDRLDVQGTVRLGGTVEVHPTSVANRAVTVLTATDGVALDPALTSTRTHLFRFDALQAGNSVQIQPRAEFMAQAASLGSNQRAVAAHLQQLWSSGANFGGFDTLAGVSNGGSYARSLNTLSGQTVGAIAAFRYSSSHNFTSSMFDDCPTLGTAGVSQDQATCVWSRAFGGQTNQGSTGAALGYRTTAWTIQAGGQRQVAPGLFIGGALAYESSSFRGEAGTSKVSGDTLMVGTTLRYQTGRWQFSGALDAGYGSYHSARTIEVSSFRASASASPTAWHAGAHARAAYQFSFSGVPGTALEGWYLQPRVDLHLNHVRSGSYTETGAGPFNLSVRREGATAFAAVPAIEVGGRIRLGGGAMLRPFASAGLSLSANSDWAATARFTDQPGSRGFRAATPIPDVLARVTAGAELLSSTNWDLRVQYSAEVGDRYTSHTGMARIAYRF